jgi:hypothetical protein
VVLLAAITVLSSCSGSGSSNAVPFSETVSGEGVSIWYECQNNIESESDDPYGLGISDTEEDEDTEETAPEYGRETKVIWIKVYKDGKLTTYTTTKNVYLGHFAKMTDEEILAELEQDTDTYLCGQKDQPFEIYLYSDATGHEVMYEGVPSVIRAGEDSDPLCFMTLFSTESIPAFQVYDSYYGGYTLYNYDETPFGEACLVTRCESGTVFGLDSMELEGAILDYATPEEMLHEKNAELDKAAQEPAKEEAAEKEKDAEEKAADDSEKDADNKTEEDAEGDTKTP